MFDTTSTNDTTRVSPANTTVANKPIVAISVRELKKEYRVGKQKIHAVNGIDLDIHKGEFVALVGASGSGKSTLLQLIGGLDKPTSGTIEINNKRLDKMNDRNLS